MITFSYALLFLILNGLVTLPELPPGLAEILRDSIGSYFSPVWLLVLQEIRGYNHGTAGIFTVVFMEWPSPCGFFPCSEQVWTCW
jgi:hypothetical protein